MMAFLMVGCHNTKTPKTTVDDVKKAEAAVYNGDMTINTEAVPEAVAAYNKYVDDNPEAVDAPEMLFRAIEVAVNTRQDVQQSIKLVDRLVTDYPDYDNNPVALFMLATFVYDEQLGDLTRPVRPISGSSTIILTVPLPLMHPSPSPSWV